MSQCAQCGASLPDPALFCPQCGVVLAEDDADEVTALPASTGPDPPEDAVSPNVPSVDGSDRMLPIPENIAGVIAYITIVPAIVFLLIEPFKRNFFVRFHAFQHLLLWIAGLAFAIVALILWAVLQLISFMRVLAFPFAGLISLAWFFLWLLLLVKAYQHEAFKLPIIGDLAETWARA